MKLITAIIRPEKLEELIEALIDSRVHGLTVSQVRGFGRQFGEPAHGADIDLGLPSARKGALLPKVRLDLVVPDDGADALVETLAKHARTDTIGDGKIWVSTLDSVLRVRTGDRDRADRVEPPGGKAGFPQGRAREEAHLPRQALAHDERIEVAGMIGGDDKAALRRNMFQAADIAAEGNVERQAREEVKESVDRIHLEHGMGSAHAADNRRAMGAAMSSTTWSSD